MSVLVTNAEDWICLDICRSLGRRGIQVGGVSHKKNALSFHSRFMKSRHVCADPAVDEGAFIDDVADIVRSNEYEYVLPANDITLMALSRNREKLLDYVDIPISSRESLEICDDKSRTIKLALKAGIPVPMTTFIKDPSDLDKIKDGLAYPVIIKPFRGQGARGISQAKSPEELKERYVWTTENIGPAMIQEYVLGERYLLAALFDRNHEPVRISVHKVKRFIGGITIYGETVQRPDVIDLGLKLLKEVKLFGMGQIDFIVDKKDNIPKLMEINPRFFGSIAIHTAAGIDYPCCLYRMLKEGFIEKDLNYKTGVRARHLLKDTTHLFTSLAGKSPYNYTLTKTQTLANYLKSFGCMSDYVFASDDPMPFVSEIGETISRKFGRRLNG